MDRRWFREAKYIIRTAVLFAGKNGNALYFRVGGERADVISATTGSHGFLFNSPAPFAATELKYTWKRGWKRKR